MILRSLHVIEAYDQEICDIMGGGDCVLALNLFKQVPFPAFIKNYACLKVNLFSSPRILMPHKYRIDLKDEATFWSTVTLF
jgi:hypothetical protein